MRIALRRPTVVTAACLLVLAFTAPLAAQRDGWTRPFPGHRVLGNLYAGDPRTGELNWSFVAEDGIVASPVVVGDLLVFGDKSGWLYGLNRADGGERWRLQLPAGIRTDPVYAGDRLLVRTEDGVLHAID